jgi:polyhydroxyalkanoate synthesis regulator phasin
VLTAEKGTPTVQNLTHYLRLACQKAGVNWNGENEYELSTIVDEVRKEARYAVLDELEELRTRVADLEARITSAEETK